MDNGVLLRAEQLHTYYSSSHILRGVDFRICQGESLALMGRNGMGKSTLLKSLIGLVRARSGEVYLGERKVTQWPTHQIAASGVMYVPEGRGIFPNLSVRENLLMAARPGVDGRNNWTLEQVVQTFPRLAERMQHGGGQLSGGEQQMLTVGRALMTNPCLLILDEATEGLAPLIAREIWRIVRTICSSGIATVIVDKNYQTLASLTHRAMILTKGSVVYDGDSSELLADHAFVRSHLGV